MVGMIFQNPDDQLFMPTVYDDVAFGPLNLGLPPEKALQRVEDALRTVGCLGLKDRPPHHLSGGQKSAVAIATVIAMRPDILVMDEPASSLDPKSRRQLITLLRNFPHTKIVASHDLDFILDVCDRCMVVSQGRITADGPAVEILSDKKLLEENNLELPLSLHHAPQERVKEHTMNDIDKLKHLVEHWAEHNKEHARTYLDWAQRAAALGRTDLSDVLKEIAEEASRIDGLFEKAGKMLG
jgi:ABC-type sulfate/molybdate transport systems ATPase subunit